MAKILNFDKLFNRRELDKITEFASKEFPAPVKLHDRRAAPTEQAKIKCSIRKS
jgi:hypothetical protein